MCVCIKLLRFTQSITMILLIYDGYFHKVSSTGGSDFFFSSCALITRHLLVEEPVVDSLSRPGGAYQPPQVGEPSYVQCVKCVVYALSLQPGCTVHWV